MTTAVSAQTAPLMLLIRQAPTPTVLEALLRALGPDAAARLSVDQVGCPMDAATADALLTVEGRRGGDLRVGGAGLLEHPWFRTVATLCADPQVLVNRVVFALRQDRDRIGWLNQPQLAARAVDNPALPQREAYLLMGLTNPYKAPAHWARMLESPPVTRDVAEGLLEAGRGTQMPNRLLRELLGSPDLDGETALWLLEQVAGDCDDDGTIVTARDLVDRTDLLALLCRTPEAEHSADALAARLQQLAALVEDHSPHGCSVLGCLRRGMHEVAIHPDTPVTDAVFDALTAVGSSVPGLCQRTDLTVDQYTDLAAVALAGTRLGQWSPTGLSALAQNPACPAELLLDAPVGKVSGDLISRAAAERFGDRVGPYLTLAQLMAAERGVGLSVAALLELAIQVTED